ncbi:anticodon-binding domain-containing protein [Scheffersomyces xylosifermentans]|uniref:anticodon-binding domain-containing protein n=1 Tax=Scheffersomyces xylosifermentans TaxID=1304137 RepID=UPI00315D8AF2
MSISDFDQIVRLRAKITTLLDQSITGYIYAFSSSNEVISLRVTSGDNQKGKKQGQGDTYRIINTAFIKSIQVLPPFPAKSGNGNNSNNSNSSNSSNNQNKYQVPLTNVSIKELESYLQESIKKYREDSAAESNSKDQESSPHKSKASPIATKLFEKFSKLYGPENVSWSGSDNIVIFKEIKLSKPYTLGKSGNIHKLKDNTKRLDEVQRGLKQFWLEVDNEKRGG